MPTEFLKKLPGVTLSNIGDVAKRVRNLIELCSMSEEELAKVIGPKCAKELISFIENKLDDVNNFD